MARALKEQSALMDEYPEVMEFKRNAGRCHYQFARLLMGHNPVEAVRQAEQARTIHKQVLQPHPDSDPDQKCVVEDQGLLALALISAGRLHDATAAAEQIPSIRPTDPTVYIHAASLLVHCAEEASKAGDRKQEEENLARAVGVLRNAVRDQVIRTRKSLDRPDLARLRDREDFKKLCDSLVESVRSG